jgi:hypothetical protein
MEDAGSQSMCESLYSSAVSASDLRPRKAIQLLFTPSHPFFRASGGSSLRLPEKGVKRARRVYVIDHRHRRYSVRDRPGVRTRRRWMSP